MTKIIERSAAVYAAVLVAATAASPWTDTPVVYLCYATASLISLGVAVAMAIAIMDCVSHLRDEWRHRA